MANHADIADYFNRRGVSAIFLFRWNLLRQLVSQLANNHDRYLKQLNGTHKAHVHTAYEVVLAQLWLANFCTTPGQNLICIFYLVMQASILARYKPRLNTTSLIRSLKQVDDYTRDALENLKSINHITIYYEDLIRNRTVEFCG